MGWVANASPEVEAQSQWATIVSICIVLTILSCGIVASRLYIRHNARGLGADDYMASLSVVFAFVYSVLCIMQTKYGLGLPIKLRPRADIIPYTKVNFAGRPIYQLGISFFKIALLISYLRLLQGTHQRQYRLIVWSTIALVFLAHLGCALSLIFACHPVQKSWSPDIEGTCLAAGPSFTGYAVVTIVSDVVVALLPIPMLLKLNVRMEKKVGLIAIFMLGLFTTMCSILRYLQINRIQFGDGNSTMLVLWGTIEFNIGNIVSSLPFLAPVCMKKAKDYRSKMSNSGSGGSGGSGGGSNDRSRNRGRKSGEHFKLRRGLGKGVFATAASNQSSSEEDILAVKDDTIVKSVTYSVRVDEEAGIEGSDTHHSAEVHV